MKRITKHKLLFGALAAALPLFVVSCLYFDNISQPERALPGSEIEITAQLRVEPGTNDKGRLVFAMLVPKAWNAAETASLSVTTKDYSQNKNGDPEVVNEPLEPMPAGEKDPKTGKPWSEAFMQVMGLGDNAGLPEQTEMEWVVWRSSTAFEIWDKITNPDNTETKFNPVHADVNIRLKTGSEPLTCYLGYSYGYDSYGLSVDEKRHADAQFKSLTVSDRVFSTTPSVFRYGDVFGIYYGLSADPGFTYEEMRDWAQRIKTELVPVDGVQKVTLFGEQQDVVNVRVSMAALASLFIAPDEIIRILGSQNALVGSSEKLAGDMQIRIIETGTYKSLDDIRNQLLTSSQGLQVRLGDIARVETGYAEPPSTLMRVNGQRAIGIGISTDPEKDVVRTGRLIERKLATITPMMPLGIALQTLYPENRIAAEANRAFVMNLLESVAIVILLIMAIMGFRAGLLIGSSLLFTIGGTLLIMQGLDVGLNRTSLAGFIIAMGMLVDNAIVVTDNAQNAMLRGVPRDRALIGGATVPQWGLFGATLIAVFSFLPLYLAPSAVAEIVKPLFVVLAISLTLSWVLALSQTPLFGSYILRDRSGAVPRDPYAGRFYRRFDRLLGALIRWRYAVAAVVLALFAGALYAMSVMPQNFFPNLDKPYFRADCFLPDGYNIRDMERQTARLDRWLRDQPSVRTVSVTMGSSPPRYYLASPSFGPKPNFANVLVELSSKDSTAAVEQRFDRYVRENCPDLLVRSSLFKLSPAVEAAIEIGFIGPDIDTLAELTEMGYGDLPVCIAKTQYSFSDNAKLIGAPTGFTMEVREVRLAAGAGFVVVICGNIMTMPGLPKKPAAVGIDVDADGKITGLF